MKWLIAMVVVAFGYDIASENLIGYADSGRFTATLLVVMFFVLGMRQVNGQRKTQRVD